MDKLPVNEEFLGLIQNNKGIIIKICNSYCSNASDREDLAQEIIYQLWKSGQSFQPGYTFTTWMYRVALNVAISFYRKKKKAGTLIALTDDHSGMAETSKNEEEINGQIHRLQQFINELNPFNRALILLYLEERSYREMAEIMGITETNVATRISRIKEQLKQKFTTTKDKP